MCIVHIKNISLINGEFMKKLQIVLLTLVSVSAFALGKEATLYSREKYDDYPKACYSFRYLSQDEEVTSNNWEILFSNGDGDTFSVNTVASDNSFIYDLGNRSCASINSTYPEDRKSRPIVWLGYSDADPSILTPERSISAKVGHCYLTYNNDEDGRVVSLFHVKELVSGDHVVIDEIEVLNDLRTNN